MLSKCKSIYPFQSWINRQLFNLILNRHIFFRFKNFIIARSWFDFLKFLFYRLFWNLLINLVLENWWLKSRAISNPLFFWRRSFLLKRYNRISCFLIFWNMGLIWRKIFILFNYWRLYVIFYFWFEGNLFGILQIR